MKPRLSSLLAVVLLCVIGPLIGASRAAAAPPVGSFLHNRDSMMCVSHGAATAGDFNVVQNTCQLGDSFQRLSTTRVPRDTQVKFNITADTGYCLSGFSSFMTWITPQLCNHSNTAQQWTFSDPYPGSWYQIRNVFTNKCIDSDFVTTPGQNLALRDCDPIPPNGAGFGNQQWQFNFNG